MSIVKFKFVVLIAVVVTMLTSTQFAKSTLTCNDVTTNVFACLSFLQTRAPLTGKCCRHIKALSNAAKTTLDRQTICSCLKSASSHVGGINFGRANSLSSRCGVRIGYRISPNIDCSRVH
ncbi:hypothetical protein MLD38_029804 [Melastoma candidum]|uniref:Uncharacterized protein n=1 Tax=Melastoma candidum TaxID=119954 RepID=A0ACB9N4V2_9MYRT|nr:hypothetical protein MLD38_029804 [Melastoma candidum]